MMPIFSRARAATACTALTLVLAACGGTDSPFTVYPKPPDGMLWTLRADQQAVTLAVGETQQLTAKAFLSSGASASETPAVSYVSTNPLKVDVTATGLVTANGETSSPVPIVATIQTPRLALVDTIWVGVTTTRMPIKTFTLHNGDPAGIRFAQGDYVPIPITVVDSSDNDLSYDLSIKYTTLSPSMLAIYGTYVNAVSSGKTKMVASTTSYGKTFIDTVDVTIGYPTTAYEYCYNNGAGGCRWGVPLMAVAVGGTVYFYNFTPTPMTLVFDDPSVVPGGSVTINNGTSKPVAFPTAGTYTFKNPNGGNGTIVVLPNL